MKREIWKPVFHEMNWPRFPCPSCVDGTLTIEKDSTWKEEAVSSRELNIKWDPKFVYKRFSSRLTCSSPSCGDTVFVCGEVSSDWDHSLPPEIGKQRKTIDLLSPRFFVPTPLVFEVPLKCPGNVRQALKKSFALMWSDTGAAANRLRVAVEALLNALKVQQWALIKEGQRKGKYRLLTLDERIRKFELKRKDASEQLMAIKWLGNVGSHGALDELSFDDLLDAYEHFEYALELIFVERSVALKERAAKINKKRGPVKRRNKPQEDFFG